VKPISDASAEGKHGISIASRTVMQSTFFKSRKDFVVSIVWIVGVVLMVKGSLCKLLCSQSRRKRNQSTDVSAHQLEM
jgi:hypothetical protein